MKDLYPPSYPRCRQCRSKMRMIWRPGRKDKRLGRYFYCSDRCKGDASRGSRGNPDCPWCEMPMHLYIGKRKDWAGVAFWYCATHRYSRAKKPAPPRTKTSQRQKKAPLQAPTSQPPSTNRKIARYKSAPENVRRVPPPSQKPLGDSPVDPGRMYKRGDGTQ